MATAWEHNLKGELEFIHEGSHFKTKVSHIGHVCQVVEIDQLHPDARGLVAYGTEGLAFLERTVMGIQNRGELTIDGGVQTVDVIVDARYVSLINGYGDVKIAYFDSPTGDMLQCFPLSHRWPAHNIAWRRRGRQENHISRDYAAGASLDNELLHRAWRCQLEPSVLLSLHMEVTDVEEREDGTLKYRRTVASGPAEVVLWRESDPWEEVEFTACAVITPHASPQASILPVAPDEQQREPFVLVTWLRYDMESSAIHWRKHGSRFSPPFSALRGRDSGQGATEQKEDGNASLVNVLRGWSWHGHWRPSTGVSTEASVLPDAARSVDFIVTMIENGVCQIWRISGAVDTPRLTVQVSPHSFVLLPPPLCPPPVDFSVLISKAYGLEPSGSPLVTGDSVLDEVDGNPHGVVVHTGEQDNWEALTGYTKFHASCNAMEKIGADYASQFLHSMDLHGRTPRAGDADAFTRTLTRYLPPGTSHSDDGLDAYRAVAATGTPGDGDPTLGSSSTLRKALEHVLVKRYVHDELEIDDSSWVGVSHDAASTALLPAPRSQGGTPQGGKRAEQTLLPLLGPRRGMAKMARVPPPRSLSLIFTGADGRIYDLELQFVKVRGGKGVSSKREWNVVWSRITGGEELPIIQRFIPLNVAPCNDFLLLPSSETTRGHSGPAVVSSDDAHICACADAPPAMQLPVNLFDAACGWHAIGDPKDAVETLLDHRMQRKGRYAQTAPNHLIGRGSYSLFQLHENRKCTAADCDPTRGVLVMAMAGQEGSATLELRWRGLTGWQCVASTELSSLFAGKLPENALQSSTIVSLAVFPRSYSDATQGSSGAGQSHVWAIDPLSVRVAGMLSSGWGFAVDFTTTASLLRLPQGDDAPVFSMEPLGTFAFLEGEAAFSVEQASLHWVAPQPDFVGGVLFVAAVGSATGSSGSTLGVTCCGLTEENGYGAVASCTRMRWELASVDPGKVSVCLTSGLQSHPHAQLLLLGWATAGRLRLAAWHVRAKEDLALQHSPLGAWRLRRGPDSHLHVRAAAAAHARPCILASRLRGPSSWTEVNEEGYKTQNSPTVVVVGHATYLWLLEASGVNRGQGSIIWKHQRCQTLPGDITSLSMPRDTTGSTGGPLVQTPRHCVVGISCPRLSSLEGRQGRLLRVFLRHVTRTSRGDEEVLVEEIQSQHCRFAESSASLAPSAAVDPSEVSIAEALPQHHPASLIADLRAGNTARVKAILCHLTVCVVKAHALKKLRDQNARQRSDNRNRGDSLADNNSSDWTDRSTSSEEDRGRSRRRQKDTPGAIAEVNVPSLPLASFFLLGSSSDSVYALFNIDKPNVSKDTSRTDEDNTPTDEVSGGRRRNRRRKKEKFKFVFGMDDEEDEGGASQSNEAEAASKTESEAQESQTIQESETKTESEEKKSEGEAAQTAQSDGLLQQLRSEQSLYRLLQLIHRCFPLAATQAYAAKDQAQQDPLADILRRFNNSDYSGDNLWPKSDVLSLFDTNAAYAKYAVLPFTQFEHDILAMLLPQTRVAQLTPTEHLLLLAVASVTVTLYGDASSSIGSSGLGGYRSIGMSAGLDPAGSAFLLGYHLFSVSKKCLPPAQRPYRLRWVDVLWALHSDSQDAILLACVKPTDTWEEIRGLAVPFWLKSDVALTSMVENLAKAQYARYGRNPFAAGLFYLSLGVKNIPLLATLFRMSPHAKVAEFLKNDFRKDRWKKAAAKNAFALLSQHRPFAAAMFFLLAQRPDKAVSTCLVELGDPMLALLVARLTGSGYGYPPEDSDTDGPAEEAVSSPGLFGAETPSTPVEDGEESKEPQSYSAVLQYGSFSVEHVNKRLSLQESNDKPEEPLTAASCSLSHLVFDVLISHFLPRGVGDIVSGQQEWTTNPYLCSAVLWLLRRPADAAIALIKPGSIAKRVEAYVPNLKPLINRFSKLQVTATEASKYDMSADGYSPEVRAPSDGASMGSLSSTLVGEVGVGAERQKGHSAERSYLASHLLQLPQIRCKEVLFLVYRGLHAALGNEAETPSLSTAIASPTIEIGNFEWPQWLDETRARMLVETGNLNAYHGLPLLAMENWVDAAAIGNKASSATRARHEFIPDSLLVSAATRELFRGAVHDYPARLEAASRLSLITKHPAMAVPQALPLRPLLVRRVDSLQRSVLNDIAVMHTLLSRLGSRAADGAIVGDGWGCWCISNALRAAAVSLVNGEVASRRAHSHDALVMLPVSSHVGLASSLITQCASGLMWKLLPPAGIPRHSAGTKGGLPSYLPTTMWSVFGSSLVSQMARTAITIQSVASFLSPASHGVSLLLRACPAPQRRLYGLGSVHFGHHTTPTAPALPTSTQALRWPLWRYFVVHRESAATPVPAPPSGSSSPLWTSSNEETFLLEAITRSRKLAAAMNDVLGIVQRLIALSSAEGSDKQCRKKLEQLLGLDVEVLMSIITVSSALTRLASWCVLVFGAMSECNFVLLKSLLKSTAVSGFDVPTTATTGYLWHHLSPRGQLALEVLYQAMPNVKWGVPRSAATPPAKETVIPALREACEWSQQLIKQIEHQRYERLYVQEKDWAKGWQAQSDAGAAWGLAQALQPQQGETSQPRGRPSSRQRDDNGSEARQQAVPQAVGLRDDVDMWLDAFGQATMEALLLRCVRVRVCQAAGTIQSWLGECVDRIRGEVGRHRGSVWMRSRLRRGSSGTAGNGAPVPRSPIRRHSDHSTDGDLFESDDPLKLAAFNIGAGQPTAASWVSVVARLSAGMSEVSRMVCESAELASDRLRRVRPPRSVIDMLYTSFEEPPKEPEDRQGHGGRGRRQGDVSTPTSSHGRRGGSATATADASAPRPRVVQVWYPHPVADGVEAVRQLLGVEDASKALTDDDLLGPRKGRRINRRGATAPFPRAEVFLNLMRMQLSGPKDESSPWWSQSELFLLYSGMVWHRQYPGSFATSGVKRQESLPKSLTAVEALLASQREGLQPYMQPRLTSHVRRHRAATWLWQFLGVPGAFWKVEAEGVAFDRARHRRRLGFLPSFNTAHAKEIFKRKNELVVSITSPALRPDTLILAGSGGIREVDVKASLRLRKRDTDGVALVGDDPPKWEDVKAMYQTARARSGMMDFMVQEEERDGTHVLYNEEIAGIAGPLSNAAGPTLMQASHRLDLSRWEIPLVTEWNRTGFREGPVGIHGRRDIELIDEDVNWEDHETRLDSAIRDAGTRAVRMLKGGSLQGSHGNGSGPGNASGGPHGHTRDHSHATCVDFHPFLDMYVSGGTKGQVLMWDESYPTPISQFLQEQTANGPIPGAKINRVRHSPSGLLFTAVANNGGVWVWQLATPTIPVDAVQAFSKKATDVVYLNAQTLFAVGGVSKASMDIKIAPPTSFLPVATAAPNLNTLLTPYSVGRNHISPIVFHYWDARASAQRSLGMGFVDLAASLPSRPLFPGTPLVPSMACKHPGPFPFSPTSSIPFHGEIPVYTATVDEGKGKEEEPRWLPSPPAPSAFAMSPSTSQHPSFGGSPSSKRTGLISLRIIDACLPPKDACILSASLHGSHGSSALLYDEASQAIISGGEKGDLCVYDIRQRAVREYLPSGSGLGTAHKKSIGVLAMDPSRRFFASGSADGSVKIWSLPSLAEGMHIPDLHPPKTFMNTKLLDGVMAQAGVEDIVLTSSHMYTSGSDGTVKVLNKKWY